MTEKRATMVTSKEIAAEIKSYAIKHGSNIGGWIESAWKFIKKNDFDIYDNEITPYIQIREDTQPKLEKLDAMAGLMAEFIKTSQQNLLSSQNTIPDIEKIVSMAEELGNTKAQLERAKAELKRCSSLWSKANPEVLKELGIKQ
jgi:uncharacterized protein YPO0396